MKLSSLILALILFFPAAADATKSKGYETYRVYVLADFVAPSATEDKEPPHRGDGRRE